ncbi:MAG: hypothetical protein MPL62_03890 [Alphaproteobacteria bacterium]|nr:hypothetical protein [Alphaproteobacteria bacterium]
MRLRRTRTASPGADCVRATSAPDGAHFNLPLSRTVKNEKRGAVNEALETNFIFLRASPHPSVGAVRLSQHRECLSPTPTNAKGCSSSVS